MNERSRIGGRVAGSSRHGLLNYALGYTNDEFRARYANQLRAMAGLGFHLRAQQRTPGPGPQVRAERPAQQPRGLPAWLGDLPAWLRDSTERDQRTRADASRGSVPRSAA